MNDDSPNIPDIEGAQGPEDSPAPSSSEGPMRSHRPATIDLSAATFRRADVSLEAAQKSLSDALRIMFGVVWGVLVLLVVLFLASGFQQIGESQRGVVLRFGKVQRENMAPGYIWSWPYPIGEVVRVDIGQRSLDVDKAFWPSLSESQRAQPLQDLAGRKRQLKPGVDGMNLIAGGAIAHTQWRVNYSVESPADYARAITQGAEKSVVLAAVEHAVVSAMAGTTVDQLLGQGAAATTSLERAVRTGTQQALDAIHTGIHVDQVILRRRSPPLFVLKDFNNVTSASAKGAQDREQADRDRRLTLNTVAGEAYQPLLRLIDDYENAIDLKDETRASDALATIDRLVDGKPVNLDNRTFVGSGQVAEIINDARRYRTDVVAEARQRAESFAAKLPQFRDNPRVFVASEWSRAFSDFRKQGIDELFSLPLNATDVQIMLNSDPEIAKRLEEARNTEEAQQARAASITRQTDLAREKREKQQQQGNGGN